MRKTKRQLIQASDIGFVWCDESRFDIVSVQIVDESMRVVGIRRGPFPAGGHDFFTVHGVDGKVFYRSVNALHWPASHSAADILEVTVALHVTGKVADR